MAKREKKVPANVENKKGKGGAKRYKLPDPLPQGTVLTDLLKKRWKIGKSIGVGGFGEVYLASEVGKTGCDELHVVKVEDHTNGPLFAEIHCLQRVGKPQLIENWMEQKKLKFLGMPKFFGIGSQENAKMKYRFMVMERYGTDLGKLLKKNKVFPLKYAYTVGIQILDVLEYLHSQGYVHNDVKAANLILGYGKSKENQVYLVDFGLAAKYIKDGKPKAFVADPRKAHDGTIEFTSRDAHAGASFSRRGDIEILGYNLLRWLCGCLPWEDKLSDAVYVSEQKRRYMSNIPMLMKTCFPTGKCPEGISEFIGRIADLDFEDEPEYELYRNILKTAIKRSGGKCDGMLVLSGKSSPLKRSTFSSKNDVCTTPRKVQKSKKTSKPSDSVSNGHSTKTNSSPDNSMANPTPAMLMVQKRKQEQDALKKKKPRKKSVERK